MINHNPRPHCIRVSISISVSIDVRLLYALQRRVPKLLSNGLDFYLSPLRVIRVTIALRRCYRCLLGCNGIDHADGLDSCTPCCVIRTHSLSIRLSSSLDNLRLALSNVIHVTQSSIAEIQFIFNSRVWSFRCMGYPLANIQISLGHHLI